MLIRMAMPAGAPRWCNASRSSRRRPCRFCSPPGLLNALIQVPSARGLVETDWGAAFIVKLVVLLVLFGVAGLNAMVLRPRVASGAERLERWFRPMMRVELALGVAVLVVTGVLTQLPSPASVLPQTEQRDNTIVRTIARADIVAELTITPNLVGFNRWEVQVSDANGQPLANAVEQLRLRFRYADPAVGPVTVAAVPEGDGRFSLEGAYFGLAGRWTVEAEMRRASGDDLVAAVESDVVSGYQTVLPFDTGIPGPLALPLTQMDWNGVGALWAFVLGGLVLVNRRHLRARFGLRAGDASLVGGVLGIIAAVVLLTGLACRSRPDVAESRRADCRVDRARRAAVRATLRQLSRRDGRGRRPAGRDAACAPGQLHRARAVPPRRCAVRVYSRRYSRDRDAGLAGPAQRAGALGSGQLSARSLRPDRLRLRPEIATRSKCRVSVE